MLLASATAPAQETHQAPPVHGVAPHYQRQNLEERVELLSRYLGLSEGQRSAIKNILLERQQEFFKIRHAPSPGGGLQMDRFRAIEDRTMEKIRAMLTEEQRKKYDPLSMRNSNSASQNVSIENWLKAIGPR